MGAMHTQPKTVIEETAAEKSILPSFFDCSPVFQDKSGCLDCGSVCNVRGQDKSVVTVKSSSSSQSRPSSGDFDRISKSASIFKSTQSSSSLLKSNSVRSEAVPSLLSRDKSLSFAGKLPADWDPAQIERLERAVQEIARRSQVRVPGPRAMQSVMAARAGGNREAANTGYDLRQEHRHNSRKLEARLLHKTFRLCFVRLPV